MDYQKLIEQSKQTGFSDLEIYAARFVGTSISVFNGEVDKNQVSDTKSISIRGIYNGKMSYLSVENDREDFDYILKTLKDNALSLTTTEEFAIFPGSASYPAIKKAPGGFSEVPMEQKVAMAKNLEKELRAIDPRIVFVPYCHYHEGKDSVEIVNSLGLNVKKTNEYGYLMVQAIAKENEDTQSGFEIQIALKYDELDAKLAAQKAAEKVLAKLNAASVDSKVYPVIFDREPMADLLEVFSSFFSGEAAVKKLTPLLGKEGQKIVSSKISIIDDPLYEGSISTQPFDDEGVACYQKAVIKDGVFQTMLHNLKTAKHFKTQTTGNGFKPSVSASVGVSGVNLYIAPGTKTREELISETQEGLLITEVAGLHAGANDITGDFSAQSSGFLILDGKIARPVNLIVVSGNFIKMMNDVDTVGNDLKIFHTGIGAPSIKFNGLPVSGK